MINALNVKVSVFKNAKTSQPYGEVILYDWLVSGEYKQLISQIRACDNVDNRRRLKEKLPCITSSGVFSKREGQGLIEHSGLICIDIDKKDNVQLENFHKMKYLLQMWDCIAYCGLSVSGEGYYCLIPIKDTSRHREHFESLKVDFASCGITIDSSCRDISRLRFASFDNAPYINRSAIPYSKIISRNKVLKSKKSICNTPNKTREEVERLISIIELHGADITEGYDVWFKIGCALAGEFGENGREYFHRISQNYHSYDFDEADHKYTDWLNIVDNAISIATLFYYAQEYGLIKNKLKDRFMNTKEMENYE